MSKRKSHAEFLEELHSVNEDIEIIGTYVSAHTKLLCRCRIDNYEWETTPNILLRSHGCPKCGGTMRKSTLQFIDDLREVNSDIELLSDYISNKTAITCRCKIDGTIWNGLPNNLLRGEFCPTCGAKSRAFLKTKTNDEFLIEMKSINQDVIFLDSYTGGRNPLRCKCKKCNNLWESTGSKLLSGYGCPVCNESHGERQIRIALNNLGVEFVSQKTFPDLRGIKNGVLSFDFYIPSHNLLIEYQGQFHDGTGTEKMQSSDQLMCQKANDQRKRDYVASNNIGLLEIWYWDFDNIEEIITNKLR